MTWQTLGEFVGLSDKVASAFSPLWFLRYNCLITPTSDKIHQPVKNALIRDGWTITNDPFTLDIGADTLYADLKAEREIADSAKSDIVQAWVHPALREAPETLLV